MAAVAPNLALYREANTYPHLLEAGIEGNPDLLSDKELHERAWSLVRPHFQDEVRKVVALFHQLDGTGRATADEREVIPAAARGEFEALLVAQGAHRWGKLDRVTGELALHDGRQPGDEDLLNVAAIHTLSHGNAVYVLRPEEMPGGRPLAAVYHLPLRKHG